MGKQYIDAPLITDTETDLSLRQKIRAGFTDYGSAILLMQDDLYKEIASVRNSIINPSSTLGGCVALAPATATRNVIQPTAVDATNLVLKAIASQTAKALEIQSSTGAVVGSITVGGVIASMTWNGITIGTTYGGTGLTSYTAGDTLYASAANTLSKLAGNTTSTLNILTQTGTGAVSAAPAWSTLAALSIVTGTGTANTGTKWTGTNTIGNGSWTDNGTTVAILANSTFTSTIATLPSTNHTNYCGIGATNSAVYLRFANSVTYTAGVTQTGIQLFSRFGTDATTSMRGIELQLRGADGSYTTTNVYHLAVNDFVKGSSQTITTQYGLYLASFTAASTNWAIYSVGGQSSHAGNFRFGSNVAPTVALDVTGAALISSTLGITGNLTMGSTKGQWNSTVGNIGLGGVVNAAIGLAMGSGISALTGTTQWGVVINPRFASDATTAINGIQISMETAAAAFTVTNSRGLYIGTPSKGAGSAITNVYGIYLENQSGGATLNYSIFSGSGLWKVGDTTDATVSTDGALVVSGGVGIAKKLFVGTALDIGTTSNLHGNVTIGGDLTITRSNSGGTVLETISNTSNTANSHANTVWSVGGTSAGNPFTTYTVSGSTSWSMGADVSNSNAFTFTRSTSLASNVIYTISVGASNPLVYQGTITAQTSLSGSDVFVYASNTSNTASSTATLYALVAGGSAGDARVQWGVTGGGTWTAGIDNSVSGDPWVLSASATLGTSDMLSVTTADIQIGNATSNNTLTVLGTGTATFGGDVTITRSNSGGTNILKLANTNSAAGSGVKISLERHDTSTGDLTIVFTDNNETSFAFGFDTSAGTVVLAASNALGTNNIVSFASTLVTFHQDFKIANNSTGSGTALLGTNCPAITVSAPYTWIRGQSADGSTVYWPAWK